MSPTVAEVADRLFSAIENGEQATVDQMWSDDITVWRVGRGPAKFDEKAGALRVIGWFISTTAERRYEILDRQEFQNGADRGFFQQHVLHATSHAGQSIAMRVCIVIKLNGSGLINRIDEYFDPAELAPLLDQ